MMIGEITIITVFLRNGWILFRWFLTASRHKFALYDFITFRHHLFIKNGSSAFEKNVIGEPHEKITFHALRIAKEYHKLALWRKLILSSFSWYMNIGSTLKNS